MGEDDKVLATILKTRKKKKNLNKAKKTMTNLINYSLIFLKVLNLYSVSYLSHGSIWLYAYLYAVLLKYILDIFKYCCSSKIYIHFLNI